MDDMLELDNEMAECGGEYAVRFRGHFSFSIRRIERTDDTYFSCR